MKGRRRGGVVLFVGAAVAALSLFLTAEIWPNASPNPGLITDPSTTCQSPGNPTDNNSSTQGNPSAADPSVSTGPSDPAATVPAPADPAPSDQLGNVPATTDPAPNSPGANDASGDPAATNQTSAGPAVSDPGSTAPAATDPASTAPAPTDPTASCSSDSGNHGHHFGWGNRPLPSDTSPDGFAPDRRVGGVPPF